MGVTKLTPFSSFPLKRDIICKRPFNTFASKSDLDALNLFTFHSLLCRIFAITTLWPPLHSRKEIENTMKRFYGKTQWHIRRINFIIENTKH